MPTNKITGHKQPTSKLPEWGDQTAGTVLMIISGEYRDSENTYMYTDEGSAINLQNGGIVYPDNDDAVELITAGTKLTITVG